MKYSAGFNTKCSAEISVKLFKNATLIWMKKKKSM